MEHLEEQQDVQYLVWTSIQERIQSDSRLRGSKKQHNFIGDRTVYSA